jgi:nucleotide-binding universal stress UspA family protein
MQPFRRILVALALAESDCALLRYAAMIAGWDAGVTLHLVHSVPSGTDVTESEVLDRMRARAVSHLDKAESTTTYSVVRGERLDSLLRFAAARKTDLILLGHRRDRSGRRSLARRLAMLAPCSVWLVPEGSRIGLQRILAPVDLSPRSADALGIATSLAAAAGLDECFGLHVRFNPAVVTFEGYEEIEMSEAQQAFYLFVARIDLHGVSVLPLFEESPDVAAAIERVAGEKDIDLIVMSTRGRSSAASVLLGSETEQTIVRSRRPVLAVKRFGARLRFVEALLHERFRRGSNMPFA